MTILEFTIDLTRLEKASGMKRFIWDAIREGKDLKKYNCKIELNLNKDDLEIFKIRIRDILKKKDTKNEIALDVDTITEQTNQLIFYYDRIQKWSFAEKYKKKFEQDLIRKQVTLQFEGLLNLAENINDEDNLALKVTGSLNKEYKLPKFTKTKKFTKELSKFLFKYLKKNLPSKQLYPLIEYKTIKRWRNSTHFKEALSSKVRDRVSDKFYEDIVVSLKLIELISSFEQFPNSKKTNSIATEDQARFVISFITLMGIYQPLHKISLRPININQEDIKRFRYNVKSLRHLLKF